MNDIYGHSVGDEVLKHLAADLQSTFGENAIIARSGGEFNIILKNRTADDAKSGFGEIHLCTAHILAQ